MKLERRFDWNDRESIYKAVDEETLERIVASGMVRFHAVRSDGRLFSGAAFEPTVAAMVDTSTGWWKLVANPKNPERSIVASADGVPLSKLRRTSEKV